MATNLGKVRYNLKGDWYASTAYLVNDLVRYKNRTYRCISANTNATPITTNIGVYWELMVATFEDQGAYAAGTTYYVGDVVTVDNSPYVVSGAGNLGSTANPRTFVSTSTSGAIPFNQINTYVCIAATTGNAPVPGTTTAYWAPLAQSGATVDTIGGRNNKSYAWGANMGIVPFGTYLSPSGAGWPPDAAGSRPGDSKYDGGLGFHAQGQQQFRVGYISKSGAIILWGRSNNSSQGRGSDLYQMSMAEMTFSFNEWYDNTLPTPDGLAPKALQWEMGYQNNLVLFNNGEVYAWGYNGHGQIGNAVTGDNQGTYAYRCGNNNGTTVLRGLKAVRIASSHRGGGTNTAASNYALMSNGQVYAWGYNGYGQLGVGDTAVRSVPTLVNQGNLSGSAVTDIFAMGQDYGHFYVITANGNMYACGYNGYGELGIGSTANQTLLTFSKSWGTTTTRIKKFTTSDRQSASSCAVLAADGSLWTWGYNNYGQLATNDTTQRNSPTQVTFPFTTGWTNVWYTAGAHTQLFATNSNAAPTTYPGYTATPNALYSCGYNGYYTLGRLVTVNSNLTHANVSGTASVQYDTYRLLPVYADTNASPVYGCLDNIHDVQSWVNYDNSYSAIYFERTTGEKYFAGYNGYGNFGHGHSDSYLARPFDASNYVANNLPKRLRNMPSGMNEADFFMVCPLGWSNYFGALWADKWGHTYFIGGGSDNGWNSTQPDVQQQLGGGWVGHYIKTAEM